jgi:transketolase
MATGSEIDLAVDSAKELEAAGKSVRVVSLPCRELFWQQEDSYRTSVLTPGVTRISIEAGTTIGWDRYIGDSGLAIGIDRFGLSAPINDIKQELGFTPNAVTARVLNHLR